MSVRHPRCGFCFLLCFVLAGSALVFAQAATPLKLGPLTVTVPSGWIAQTNANPVRAFSPDSTLLQYFQVEFFPPEQTLQDVREHHSLIVGRLAGMMRSGSVPQNGMSGKFIWTRIELQRAPDRSTLSCCTARRQDLSTSALRWTQQPPRSFRGIFLRLKQWYATQH